MTSEGTEESNLVRHAREELLRAGLFGAGSDYDGGVGECALAVVKAFSTYGHSGGSAAMTLDVVTRLLQFQALSPITSNSDEWMLVADGIVEKEEPPLWQCRRNGALFSNDGGNTYYSIDEPLQVNGAPPLHTSAESNEKGAPSA